MPILLQIDSCLNMLSTGRITESIAELAIQSGWDVYIAHGARYIRPGSCMHTIRIGNKLVENVHFLESLLFDNHGLASRKATKRLICQIKKINPDVIQLHCIHGYYLNYKILFEYLNGTDIPVVWTFHDCWAFTGHCAHFITANCVKWKNEGCNNCPLKSDYPRSIFDQSNRNYCLKKMILSANNNLHIVAVSDWMAGFTRESFLGSKDIRVINNGVDISIFKPLAEKPKNVFRILGVASSWNKDKGLYDFYKLRKELSEEFEIILVGLTQKQIDALPIGIKGVNRTNSVQELASLYSESHVLVNPTYADTFPTVNMEALACGTPVITYMTGGSPEIIDENTGVVVEQGDVDGLVRAVKQMKNNTYDFEECRKRAVAKYDKEQRFADYISLYNSLLK